jgi:sodium-coupled neutral amino acid transporter 11
MEAFVARHVLFSLLDGKTDLEGDEDVTEASPGSEACFIFSRRHLITLAIYISTLLPALLVDDLGPVLSITGAIGASSISYIAPGLIYLGINGEAFILYCHKFFGNNGKHGKNIELPVVGDSSQKMSHIDGVDNSGSQPPELPVVGEVRVLCSLEYEAGVKPWWWWILGFPIWYSIAFKGMSGMQNYLSDTPEQPCFQLQNDSSMDSTGNAHSNILPNPKGWDFYTAIVFVVFGVVALAAGLTANILHIVK